MADGGNFILGRNNASNATTRLVRNGGAGNDAFSVENSNGFGISGTGTVTPTAARAVGLYGFSRASGDLTAGPGVYGESTNGTGVFGESQTEGYGVHGSSFGTGVRGQSRADGSGVFGSSANGHGVAGLSSNPSRAGVFGSSSRVLPAETAGVGVAGTSPDNSGVVGTSLESFGVFGRSRNGKAAVLGAFSPQGLRPEPPFGDGVVGTTLSGRGVAGFSPVSGIGVLGRADAEGSRGVVGFSTNGFGVGGVSANGFAGVFDGDVFVRNDVTVLGAKSAAVPHPDGSHRRLYALESPESWFEDFGSAELVRGRAEVVLDPNYSALVETDHYYVFLTPEGDSNGLYVTNKGSLGFEVREQQEGTGTLSFSYRVVAKRADIELERLETVEVPPPIQPDTCQSVPEPPYLEQLDERPEQPNVLLGE